MAIKTILVVIPPGPAETARVSMAFALGKNHAATVIGLHLVPTIMTGAARDLGQEARALEETLVQRARDMQVGMEWQYEQGDEVAIAEAAARCADLLVVDPELARDLVFAAGVPVLAVPDEAAGVAPKRVLIAWNGSREAARAVRDALPLIREADTVVALTIDPPDGREAGRDLAGFLRRHGIGLEIHRRRSGSASDGTLLLQEAKTTDADLLVMGAYGHSRFREWILGGATDEVISETRIPVLLSH